MYPCLVKIGPKLTKNYCRRILTYRSALDCEYDISAVKLPPPLKSKRFFGNGNIFIAFR